METKLPPQLLPSESVALTIALSRVLRGDELPPNTATMCVLALARICGRHDWTKDDTLGEALPLT